MIDRKQFDDSFEGKLVTLALLSPDHYTELFDIAADTRIWQHMSFNGTRRDEFSRFLHASQIGLECSDRFPFVIVDRPSGKLIGMTALCDIVAADTKIGIGHSWLHSDWWASGRNLETKLMLLTFCFEKLLYTRVQIRIQKDNVRSRMAAENLGAVFEGVLRNDKIGSDGQPRDLAYYSVISKEWPACKEKIKADLKNTIQAVK